MEIFIIVTLVVLIIYFFIKVNNLRSENKKNKDQIVNLTQDLNEARINSTKFQSENGTLKFKLKTVETELSNFRIKNREQEEKVFELGKYQNIIDVKVECEYLLKKAQKDYEKLRERGNLELSEAQENARESRRNIKELTEKKQREIELLYENAVRESKRIINTAENKAESIGGDAYRSLREANEMQTEFKR